MMVHLTHRALLAGDASSSMHKTQSDSEIGEQRMSDYTVSEGDVAFEMVSKL